MKKILCNRKTKIENKQRNLSAFKLCLIVLILLSGNAFCYTLTTAELNKTILNQLNSEISNNLKNKDYKITISQIPNIELKTNENIKPKIELINPNKENNELSFNSFSSFRKVIIKNSQNDIIKIIPINVQIKLYENVLVALDTIPYGTIINQTNAKIEKREVSKIYNKTLNKIEDNIVASRNILKGNIILKNSIKQKAIITRNSDIDIIFFSNNGLKITLRGKALKDGAIGENILVKSDKYNKIYNATIQSEKTVTVRI